MTIIIIILLITTTLFLFIKVIYGFKKDLHEIRTSEDAHLHSSNVIEIQRRYNSKGLIVYKPKHHTSLQIMTIDNFQSEIVQESEYNTKSSLAVCKE